jgi:hypothetical protein
MTQLSRWRLPNEQQLTEGLADTASALNKIIFEQLTFREANRELRKLLERMYRLIEGYRRSVNR